MRPQIVTHELEDWNSFTNKKSYVESYIQDLEKKLSEAIRLNADLHEQNTLLRQELDNQDSKEFFAKCRSRNNHVKEYKTASQLKNK